MKVETSFKVPSNSRTIDKAIKKVGTQAELARRLQASAGVMCYPQKINEWRNRGIIPPYWVKHVATVLEILPHEVDHLLYD
jgi:hypothetical protein